MKKVIRHVGLDVDSAAIAAAVAEPGGEIRSLGSIPYREEVVRKLVKKLGPASELRICYEAGPHGYRLYWLLTKLGVQCEVVAPTLIPTRAGDRVKANRRDAEKLARSYRSGDLTLRFEHVAVQATFIDYLHEVKHAGQRISVLEAAIDETIAAAPASIRALITALQALRGIKSVSAATMAAEIGPPSRFTHPKQLMGYSGMVSSEHSTGLTVRRGAITKTGNAHLRRIMGQAAWSYQHRPSLSAELRRRQAGASAEVREISWKAQQRLCSRFRRLSAKGKVRQKVVTAIARELLGFVWAIGIQVEKETQHPKQRHGRAA